MRGLLIPYLLLCGLNLFGQNHLNKILPSIGGAPASSVMVNDDEYVLASTYILDLRRIDFARLSNMGALLQSKSYTFSNVNEVTPCSKCLKERDKRIYFAQTNFVRSDSIYSVFWKFDQNLDSIQTKKHFSFQSGQPQVEDMEFDTDSTFIVTGYLFQSQTGKYDFWIAKLDTSFNILWEQRIIENTPGFIFGYWGEDLTIDQYGSVLVGASVRLINNSTQTHLFKSTLARLDRANGNVKWVKDLYIPPGGANIATLDEGDGTYRFAQMQHLSIFPRTTIPDSNQIRFGLIDTTGTIVWDTLIGPKWGRFYFRDMQRTSDGNYYLAGEQTLAYVSATAGFKISPQGDSLWMRNYLYQDSFPDVNHAWSFQQTQDSGFVHVGLFTDFDYDIDSLRLQYLWLLKTDKYGCAMAGCHEIGLTENQFSIAVSIYPNPSGGELYVELPEVQKDLELHLYDIRGVKRFSAPVTDQVNKYDFGNLAGGMYLVKVTKTGREIFTRKIIIQ